MDFTEDEVQRYSRNILLKEIGASGQEKIRGGRVLVVGAGGLGSPVVLYLAAAGVGTLGIADGERVELSNLQRQIVHFTGDVGREKVLSAREKVLQLNAGVEVVMHRRELSRDNAAGILTGYDFVVEGTDRFASKYLVNDACVDAGKPFSAAGISRFEGQVMTHLPGTACYRCLFPTGDAASLSCAGAGVLGAVAGMAGTILAAEALKFLTGAGELLTNRLLLFDARTMLFTRLGVSRRATCDACSRHK